MVKFNIKLAWTRALHIISGIGLILILVIFWLFFAFSTDVEAYAKASKWTYPMKDWKVSSIGYFGAYIEGRGYHLADDVVKPVGTPIYAAANGQVKLVTRAGGYGPLIIIEHTLRNNKKICSLYGHLSNQRIKVKEGQIVSMGQQIGIVGRTSENGGWVPHLHFGLRPGGYSKDWLWWGYGDRHELRKWIGPTDFIERGKYTLNYHAEWIEQSPHLEMRPGQLSTLWVKFKNTGDITWYRLGINPQGYPSVNLGGSYYPAKGRFDRESIFYSKSDWLSPNRPTTLDQKEVAPGEIGKFTFVIKAPNKTGIYKEYFRLVADGECWMNDVGLYWRIKVTKKPLYSAEWLRQSKNLVTLMPGQTKKLWIEFRNTGRRNWYRNGKNPVRLGTAGSYLSGIVDRKSVFKYKSWIKNDRPANLKQKVVKPGQIGRFEFTIKAPNRPGTYREYFRPVVENKTWMEDWGVYWDIEVQKPVYSARWIRQSPHLTLERGQTATLWVEFENTGNTVWSKNGRYPVYLGTAGPYGSDIVDRDSVFRDKSWIKKDRPAKMDRALVKPGETVRFTFKIKVPENIKNGIYKEYFRPVVENKTWMEDWGVYWEIKVKNRL